MYEELVEKLKNLATLDVPTQEVYGGARITTTSAEFIDGIQELAQEAADAIEELEFACNRYEKDYKALCEYLPKWISVSERLPEDGSDILAVHSYCGEVRIIPANYDRGVWYDCVYNRQAEHITHWMPVPKPPTGCRQMVTDSNQVKEAGE